MAQRAVARGRGECFFPEVHLCLVRETRPGDVVLLVRALF